MIQYTKMQDIEYLKDNYDYLVGWGVGRDEFLGRYNPSLYHLDYMIDGRDHCVGQIKCGMKISPKSVLNEIKDKGTICFIIYPNPELEIIQQIQEFVTDFSVIVSRLVNCGEMVSKLSFSTDNEDRILLNALKCMKVERPYYVDIGVCHPVIRNNTYLFYHEGYTEGVLIEPNPIMCGLAELYRPKNKIVKMGACGGEGGTMQYYQSSVSAYTGYNTFDKELALKRGFDLQNGLDIPVHNINQIFEENCVRCPDVIDIDTEGMDFELLQALDTERFRVKLICTEICTSDDEFDDMMKKKRYIHFMRTSENGIYLAEEYIDKFHR